MPESFATRIDRLKFNFFPAYRGTGARIVYISNDYREIRVKIPLSWRTRNYVGTIYGGSLYAGIDPIYMLMLIKNLGKDYIVWDKAAKIRFKRPGKETLFADFLLTEEELDEIKTLLETCQSVDRIYNVELADRHGKVHAIIEKTLYIAKKESEKVDCRKSTDTFSHLHLQNKQMNYFENRAFIFDMDGTLVDNMSFHTEAWGKMLEENGVEMNAHDFLVKTAGKTNREILPTVFGDISKERIAKLGDRKEMLYRELFRPHRKVVSGAVEFLEEAQGLGVKMAVATAAPITNMEFILDGLDLRRFFGAVTTANDIQNGKPLNLLNFC